jgi:hypothetical protein
MVQAVSERQNRPHRCAPKIGKWSLWQAADHAGYSAYLELLVRRVLTAVIALVRAHTNARWDRNGGSCRCCSRAGGGVLDSAERPGEAAACLWGCLVARLLVAVDPAAGVAPADVAGAWDGDDEARAAGLAGVEVPRPGEFLGDVTALAVIPLAVNLASTRGARAMAGSGRARIIRISVIRLTPAANGPDSRAPARPSSARAIACNAPVRSALRRPCRTVRPGTCSAKVRPALTGCAGQISLSTAHPQGDSHRSDGGVPE